MSPVCPKELVHHLIYFRSHILSLALAVLSVNDENTRSNSRYGFCFRVVQCASVRVVCIWQSVTCDGVPQLDSGGKRPVCKTLNTPVCCHNLETKRQNSVFLLFRARLFWGPMPIRRVGSFLLEDEIGGSSRRQRAFLVVYRDQLKSAQ